jgi:glycyl-tRNA synthetase beta chain
MARTVDLVLEIGVEELPARFVAGALEQLKTNGAKLFVEARLGALNPPEVYGTPRRLLFVLRNVAEKQEPQDIELKGPSVKAGRTPNGEWTPAAVGFATKAGIEPSQLVEREGYFYAIRRDEGQKATEVASGVFPQLIRSLTFPKTMRWGNGSFRFGRPIRWITALCGEDVPEFDIEGLKAGRTSYGHRFLARQAFEARDSAHLLSELMARFCLYNQEERRKEIVRQLDLLATGAGGRVAWDAVEGLLDEVTQMVEWPKAYVGSYDRRFLALPRCVTIEVMRKHQQYFPLETHSGELLPHFVVVTNGRMASFSLRVIEVSGWRTSAPSWRG